MENHGLVKLVTLGMAAAITDHEEAETQEDSQIIIIIIIIIIRFVKRQNVKRLPWLGDRCLSCGCSISEAV